MDFLKNSQNKILVCIPAYNAEDCLSDTIKSILCQTFKQFDILVIDNQSDDKTIEVAQKIKRDFDEENKIYIIKNRENLGRIGNWNKCIEIFRQTRHPYLKLMVTGDTLEKRCLEKLLNIFNNNPSLGIVSSGYYVHTSKNKIEKKNSFEKSAYFAPSDALKAFIQKGNWIGSFISCMFSRKSIEEINFSEGFEWTADWKLYIDIVKKFDSFYINELLSNFYALRRKYYIKHNNTPASRAEELFVAHYALQKLEDLNPSIAKNFRKDLHKIEGRHLFQNLSLFDIGALTAFKLAKHLKNIFKSNSF